MDLWALEVEVVVVLLLVEDDEGVWPELPQPNVKLGELLSCGATCWPPPEVPPLEPLLPRDLLSEFSEAEVLKPVCLGGLAALVVVMFLLVLLTVESPLLLLLLLPLLLLRTCLSSDARRFTRQLCSDSTRRGHGLHSTMSKAATATARPTCS